MRSLILALIIICLLVAAGVVYLFLGYYDISATRPHWKITAWIIEEVREHSVKFYSKTIQPRDLKDPRLLKIGVAEYYEMCRLCHGAPGHEEEKFAKGLYPKPPKLASEQVQEMSDAEGFWILKNGIKMTGMPAFGPTHNDEELWGIISFWRRLPALTPDQYEELLKSSGVRTEKEEDHHH